MVSSDLPKWLEERLPAVEEIHRRLRILVPSALDPEGYVRRELAAKVVFVMLYGFAVEGEETWIRPTAVTDMTDNQARIAVAAERKAWLRRAQGRNRPAVTGRWFGENTRESIRDETLRRFIDLGIVVERSGLATTSPSPRYALARDFLKLCDPDLLGAALEAAVGAWREQNLSRAELARLALIRSGAGSDDGVSVRLPNSEVRRLSPGGSSLLTKAVVEVFAPRFLLTPAVVLLSESARKVTYQDKRMLNLVGLEIDGVDTLPDLVLADVGCKPVLLVFVECVVTAGEISKRRRKELETLAAKAGYQPSDYVFVSAFHDRVKSPFRSCSTSLAWDSFVWFETEPDRLVVFRDAGDHSETALARLLDRRRG